MRKPFLILQLRPEDQTADSEFAAFLKYGGLEPSQARRLRIEETGIPEALRLDDYAAIIVGGSPFDISTPVAEKKTAQLRVERDFQLLLQRVVEQDFPFLGACSGNGLLGAFLGTPISRRFAEPVGCARVSLTPQGLSDPLLKGFPQEIEVLLGHKEACDELPSTATLLVTGSACPVQMFRVGSNVYATQFHPEGDVAGFTTRIQVYRHHGYFPAEQADQLINALTGCDPVYGQRILRRFVQRYQGGAGYRKG